MKPARTALRREEEQYERKQAEDLATIASIGGRGMQTRLSEENREARCPPDREPSKS